ncbi:hypothetical protein [Streptomyces sp. NPDC048419]|uniref:hypothetical protein n=1 Tax=Streptomyces sp. NPDC048419 TaxID=3365547 RepID=UPI003714472B
MLGVVRVIRSIRGPAAGGVAGQVGDASVPAGVLRRLLAGIGTTLDEPTTCAELARAVTGHFHCSAAVMRVEGAAVTGYEAVTGDPGGLPDARWATAVAHDMTRPTLDGWTQLRIAYPSVGRARPALCVLLATVEHRSCGTWRSDEQPVGPAGAVVAAGIKPGRPQVWTRRQLIDGIRWRTLADLKVGVPLIRPRRGEERPHDVRRPAPSG